MKISIVTLFPNFFEGVFTHSILKLAQEKKVVQIEFVDIRTFGIGKHKIVDDKPYGGGAGMVMRVDVVKNAIDASRCRKKNCKEKIILFDARGKTYNQKIADIFAKADHLILVCGHYEGIDDRIRAFVDEEISVGDYILTGGEIPAMILIDSVVRLIPGTIKEASTKNESFSNDVLLEYPQYTRPEEFLGKKVPDILLSGNHAQIEKWQKEKALAITKKNRPDLLDLAKG